MFSDQSGKFPHTSIKETNYHLIVHKIDGNSTWIKPMKNRTKGEMILARRHALARMKLQGINPKHQVQDIKISAAYKAEIQAMHMTYHLVLPNDHHRNIAEKAIHTSERSLCVCPHWDCSHFPHAPLVPINPTIQTLTSATTTIQREPSNFRLHPCLRSPKLRC